MTTTEAAPEPLFRAVMAQVCTPVTVVTAMDGDRPHGTTVSAFASLSISPPMVLVSLSARSDLLALVTAGGSLGVNVLGQHQVALAKTFARKGVDKFADVDWSLDYGLPRIAAAPGWLACAVDDLVEGGDHFVAFARVLRAAREPAPPLTYHERAFGTHTAIGRCHPHGPSNGGSSR